MNSVINSLRNGLLNLYTFLIGYRFNEELKGTPPSVPDDYKTYPDDNAIRAKATASLASVAIFLGLAIAALAAVMAAKEYGDYLRKGLTGGWTTTAIAAFIVLALYFAVRQERVLSRAKKRKLDYLLLLCLLLVNFIILFVLPMTCRQTNSYLFCQELSPSKFAPTLSLAGLAAIVTSILFQVFAAELYDSAAGWRGQKTLRFHLASLASHSFLIGIALAILGVALLLSYVNFWLASIASLVTLCAIVGLTEIERALWYRIENASGNATSCRPEPNPVRGN